jgi:hypothetical protein
MLVSSQQPLSQLPSTGRGTCGNTLFSSGIGPGPEGLALRPNNNTPQSQARRADGLSFGAESKKKSSVPNAQEAFASVSFAIDHVAASTALLYAWQATYQSNLSAVGVVQKHAIAHHTCLRVAAASWRDEAST